MGSASLKVAGGKLVKARVETAAGSIARVKITGDFFLHPEDAIGDIEAALVGISLDEAVIAATVSGVLSSRNAQLIGAAPADFARVILEASK
jgi:lipoate-protein ligase A